MLYFDSNNYQVANDATRDILFMYRDLIESYRGFGHGIDTGSFDAFATVTCHVEDSALELDQDLLRVGGVVALLCHLSDSWDETDLPPSGPWMKRVCSSLDSLVFHEHEDLRDAVRAGLEDEAQFRSMLPAIYDRHVVGYFRRLSRAD